MQEPSAVQEATGMRVIVIADVETNATQLVERILTPAGFEAWPATDDAPTVVASLDDLDQILARLVEAAAYVTDAEEASIYLADTETDEVVLRATKQAGDRQATLQRLRADDMLVGQVVRSGQPILRKPRMDSGPVKVQTGFMVQSVVKVPIRMREEVVGVLGVYNRLALRSFNEQHVSLLMTLADWAGVALDRAALVQQASASSGGTGPISLVPPSLIEGLDTAIATLEAYVNGQNALGQKNSELLKLQDQLRELRALPISTIEPEAAEQLVDLARLIQRAAADHQLQAARRGLNLTVESEAPVPMFAGDSSRVYQVIDALVAAAIRRTMTGRVMLQILVFDADDAESEGVLLPADLD